MYAAVNHFATPDFWFCHRHLPLEVRELADKNFGLLHATTPATHPVRLKKVGAFWSAGGLVLSLPRTSGPRKPPGGVSLVLGSAITVNTTG